ncbi:MAG TPA: 4-hydroxy-tetrahydrodipicolinate synthase [Longimicrobiales bacterium]|nr:4-hydroxy-tetrahydrodipicolinate synthase [Longimicrobiales bacterium]
MADPRFDGSGVALVTPFDQSGVNEGVLESLVRFHHDNGTDALVVCGSTGEAATMTPEEQRRATEVVVQANAGRLPVIVGCGGTDTRQVRALAAQARQAGADAVLLSAPPYNKPPQRGLIAHFRAVMDAADMPAIIYNVPGRAAVNILPETIAALAEADGRVIGVKEACGDISQIAELARLAAGRFAIWSGNDDQILPVLSLGGRGVITVLGNVAPRQTSRMVHAFLEGSIEEATGLQLACLPLVHTLFADANPIPVKTAVAWLGFDVGDLRPPLCAIEPALRDRLIAELESLGITPGMKAAR